MSRMGCPTVLFTPDILEHKNICMTNGLENKPLYSCMITAVCTNQLDIDSLYSREVFKVLGSDKENGHMLRSGHVTGHTCPAEAYPVATHYNHGYTRMNCYSPLGALASEAVQHCTAQRTRESTRSLHRLSISYEIGPSYGSKALAANWTKQLNAGSNSEKSDKSLISRAAPKGDSQRGRSPL